MESIVTTLPVRSTTYLEVDDDCRVIAALRCDDTIDVVFGDDQHAAIITFTPAGLRAFTAKLTQADQDARRAHRP